MNTSDLPLPAYQTDGAACFDLMASINEPLTLLPGERAAVPTGIHVALPEGHELQIRGRSGLAAKHGIGLVNGVGTVDSDYRGEIRVILINYGNQPFDINHGDRIAQAMVCAYERVAWQSTDTLEATGRDQQGFGSTGV